MKSNIPSRINHISILDVTTGKSLKVKRCTLVMTSCEASSDLKEKIKEDEQSSSHPIIVRQLDDLEVDTGLATVPETLENKKAFNTANKWQVLEALLPLRVKCLNLL